MNLISVAMFALNVNVDGNSRQARVNGRSDCVGVLCRAVVCCAVSCCGVLCCGVVWCGVVCCGCRRHFFAHFLRKKRITFHDVCFSKPLTFHNDFMFFCLSQLFQALFETTSPTYFTSQVGACCLEKCLKQLRQAKKHEIIVEG